MACASYIELNSLSIPCEKGEHAGTHGATVEDDDGKILIMLSWSDAAIDVETFGPPA